MAEEKEYVEIEITGTRFTDGKNQLWSPGVHQVDEATAKRLIAGGRAQEVSGKSAKKSAAKGSAYVKKSERGDETADTGSADTGEAKDADKKGSGSHAKD